MRILAIETSCDDTCIAILEASGLERNPEFKILSNIVSSQVKIHRKYGGVYPFLAKREHQKNLPIVLKKTLKTAGNPEIDLIAVTIGPGLEPCLWVGVNFAQDLAKKLNLKIIPVNHIEAHIFANLITKPGNVIKFPAICLVASGGHTQLILMKGLGKYKILGETRDDAAGECFDKVARILKLGYPGGPIISRQAAKATKSPKKQISNKYTGVDLLLKLELLKLPRPMMYQKNYDFSFSGLKTAVLYNYRSRPAEIQKSKRYIQMMCKEVQQAVIDVLIHKTLKAAKEYKVKTVILGGGVAANEELRKQINHKLKNYKLKFLVPPKIFCTDNAAMTGATGYFNWFPGKFKKRQDIEANANLRI